MTTQKELARSFAFGADSGSASNMTIVRDDVSEQTHLVGYGWAVYATRHASGEITLYEDGWREWARERGGRATHGQFAEIRKGLPTYEHVRGKRPTIAAPPSSVNRVGTTPTR